VSEMDKVLLIHSPDNAGKREVVEATRRLRSVGSTINGIVFNNVGRKEIKHYYLQEPSYGHYYSSRPDRSSKEYMTTPARQLPQGLLPPKK
jgi:nucleoside diphosphate kinase